MKRLLVLISLLLLLASPVQAQTGTHTPTSEPTQSATLEITPEVVVTPEIDDTAPTSPEITIEGYQSILNGLVAVLGIVVAVGIPLSIGAVVMLVRSLRSDKVVLRALEIAYESASPTTQKIIAGGRNVARDITELASELGEFIEDVTDGIKTEK